MSDWNKSPQETLSFIKHHVEMGITTVDHAHVYGQPPAESLFGKALKLESSVRDSIEIVTKAGINVAEGDRITHYDSGKKAICSSVDTSLSRLGTDYIDVLLIHRPDYLMDADEIAEAFSTLKSQGKVKYLGVSNFTPTQFSLLQSRLDEPLVTNQIEINPLNLTALDDGTLDDLQQRRVLPMAWSSLAGGQLFTGDSERIQRIRREIVKLQDELGTENADQIVYAWVLQLPSQPVVLLGTGNTDRIDSALKSLDVRMNREQWYRLWVASKGHNVP